MIAPDGRGGKSLARPRTTAEFARFAPQPPGCGIFDRRNHGFVKRFTMQPHFSQARAKLDCEVMDRCLRARSGSRSGFLSPPAPRGVDGSGQSFRVRFNPPIFRPAKRRPFCWACVRQKWMSDCAVGHWKRGYRGQRSSPPLIPVICRPSPVVRSERTRYRGRCPVFRAFLPARSARRHRCRRFRSRRSECSSLRPCR
jgi:hypothetical protein